MDFPLTYDPDWNVRWKHADTAVTRALHLAREDAERPPYCRRDIHELLRAVRDRSKVLEAVKKAHAAYEARFRAVRGYHRYKVVKSWACFWRSPGWCAWAPYGSVVEELDRRLKGVWRLAEAAHIVFPDCGEGGRKTEIGPVPSTNPNGQSIAELFGLTGTDHA